ASRTKRWRKLRLPARSAVSTFSATIRLRWRCSARKTTPMPPRPATASILYPATSSPISGRRISPPPSSETPGAVGLRATSSEEPGPTAIARMLRQCVETAEHLVDVSRVRGHIEDPIEIEIGCFLGQQLAERGTGVPRSLCVLLNYAVRV